MGLLHFRTDKYMYIFNYRKFISVRLQLDMKQFRHDSLALLLPRLLRLSSERAVFCAMGALEHPFARMDSTETGIIDKSKATCHALAMYSILLILLSALPSASPPKP